MNKKQFKPYRRGGPNKFHRKPLGVRVYRHNEQLLETDVGITEFLSTLPGFSGIIKARFSDFHVNEIDQNGVVAKLTDTNVPKDFVSNVEKIDVKEVVDSPLEQISQEVWESIKKLATEEDAAVSVKLGANEFSKEDRTKIHECIKNIFGQKLVVSTVNEEDNKMMIFRKFDKEVDGKDVRRKWPDDKPDFVHFLLYKEALDTMDAALKISDCLKMATPNFAYAGVKDKRAKTTQWFSVKRVEPWKLIIKTKQIRNIRIGNITFKDTPLKLGQLSGNKFRIALRNIVTDDKVIDEAMNQLKEVGFINYYGLQRFGNDKEVPTYTIGINLLLGKWKEAVLLILKPKAADDPELDISKAKKSYAETGVAEVALKVLERNKNKCLEYKLLMGLSKGHANDYVNALENIPRNTRLLYLHSFQSFIWNKIVSKRIKEFGLKPVVGDLVLILDEVVEEEDTTDDIKCKQEVKVLSDADLESYTIYDVVLPLPGYDVVYPEHLKEYYKAALEEHGLNLDMTKQKVKTYNLSGNYRKILSKVQDLSWKTLKYNSHTDTLIRSDVEELQGKSEPKSLENGLYTGLVVEFSLHSASYATMVLREIMKSDTSTSAHAKMNNYHEIAEAKGKSKRIIVSDVEEQRCDSEEPQSSSLLWDEAKYDAFKNSIFNVTATEKRKGETEENGQAKKARTEEAGGGE